MLYSDSLKRINKINRIAEIFKEESLPLTSVKVSTLTEILNQPALPTDYLKNIDDVFDIFQNEFVNRVSVGKQYRESVFLEFKQIIVEALGRMSADFTVVDHEVLPIVQKMKKGRNAISDIAEQLQANKQRDDKLTFHMLCYAFLIMFESVFDETARALYCYSQVTPTNIPTTAQLRSENLKTISRKLTAAPVFLANWNEKRRIRNAIAHGQAYFDSNTNEVRFIDDFFPHDIYDRTMSLSDFKAIGLECDDVVLTFEFIIMISQLIFVIGSQNFS